MIHFSVSYFSFICLSHSCKPSFPLTSSLPLFSFPDCLSLGRTSCSLAYCVALYAAVGFSLPLSFPCLSSFHFIKCSLALFRSRTTYLTEPRGDIKSRHEGACSHRHVDVRLLFAKCTAVVCPQSLGWVCGVRNMIPFCKGCSIWSTTWTFLLAACARIINWTQFQHCRMKSRRVLTLNLFWTGSAHVKQPQNKQFVIFSCSSS